MLLTLHAADWVQWFLHFLMLSLLAVGGAITTVPEMHRYLVTQQAWLSDAQFTAAIALAQAAPGPNVLFVALMGWSVGVNAGGGPAVGPAGWPLGLLGVGVSLAAILIPSSAVAYLTGRWAHRHRDRRGVKAFKQGMAPIVVGLLLATGWLLMVAHDEPARDAPLWALGAVTTVVVWKTRWHLLWLLGAGAVLGGLGWI